MKNYIIILLFTILYVSSVKAEAGVVHFIDLQSTPTPEVTFYQKNQNQKVIQAPVVPKKKSERVRKRVSRRLKKYEERMKTASDRGDHFNWEELPLLPEISYMMTPKGWEDELGNVYDHKWLVRKKAREERSD